MDAKVDDSRTRLFISYSRKDFNFVVWLASSLNARGCLSDFDRSTEDPSNVTIGISAEDAWWVRLEEMITVAEVIVFVVSPASIRSKVCEEEIAFAQGSGKRIIPILCRPINLAKAPPRLSALNIKISFAHEGECQSAEPLEQLIIAVHQDVKWLRTATRLVSAAKRWDTAGRPNDQLLRGVEQRDAENWAARRPPSGPQHPELLLDFLAAGREAKAERKTIGEIEKARYLELIAIMRPFLEEELRLREAMPVPGHWGLAEEDRLEMGSIRSLLYLENSWHPQTAVHLSSTGAVDGYAEIFNFPCCGLVVRDFRSTGAGNSPSQFRSDGCKQVPEAIQHEYRERSNPFYSVFLWQYRKYCKEVASNGQ